jgi:hypothetical protein
LVFITIIIRRRIQLSTPVSWECYLKCYHGIDNSLVNERSHLSTTAHTADKPGAYVLYSNETSESKHKPKNTIGPSQRITAVLLEPPNVLFSCFQICPHLGVLSHFFHNAQDLGCVGDEADSSLFAIVHGLDFSAAKHAWPSQQKESGRRRKRRKRRGRTTYK